MSKVKVLIEGYAKPLKNGWLASSSVTLIEDSGKRILIDPGINKKLLLEKLEQEQLTLDDFDIIFLTHYHLDHAFLASLFDKAKVMDGTTIYETDKEVEYNGLIPGTNLEVLPTPGHAQEHSAVLVMTDKDIIAISADVFWWTAEEKQETDDIETLINREDPFVQNKAALIASRKKVIEIADWIIPGHGKMFKINKK